MSLPISIPQSLPLISITSVRLVTVEIPFVYFNVSVICFICSITSFLKISLVSRTIIPIAFPPNLLPTSLYSLATESSSGKELIISELIFKSLI